jgi:hypothetical protein
MGPISAFPMTPSAPAITIAAAGDASRELKRAKNSSGRAYATSRADEERLKRRSNKMAKEFEGAMEKSVKRKLDSMSGSQNNRKLGLKVAQFIPGKGLEVAGAQVENDPAIYCSLGLKGEKHVDPLDETFARIKGRQVSMDFAFKLINPVDKLLGHDKDTRVTAMNCFRHVNPDSFNYSKTGWTRDVSQLGTLLTIDVTSGGAYYTNTGVNVNIQGGGGDGTATATANLIPIVGSSDYELESVTITNSGGGFTSAPTITFIGPGTSGGTPATAVATIDTTNTDKAVANYNWHSTLGPDASLVRCGTAGKTTSGVVAGTWRGFGGPITYGTLDSESDAKSNTLMSPYRYPKDMEIMYSRVNRQLMENYGWLLNPFKFINPSSNSVVSSPDPVRDDLRVWSNPGVPVLDFTDTTAEEDTKKYSYPAQVNVQTDDVVTTQATQSAGAGFEWHSQFGPGKLSYQFSNDGTNPVCIDICVVGIKKDSPVPVELLQNICDYNYAVHKFANKNSTNVNGFQTGLSNPGSVDLTLGKHEWHKNAKLPFMPDECFKNPQSYLKAVDYDPSGSQNPVLVAKEIFSQTQQGKKNPFKVVKRDQFIVSSGSSRAWNTTLPSIKYRPQLYEDVDYPLDEANDLVTGGDEKIEVTADEYTFIFCIGASGLPKPVEEVYSSTKPISFDEDGSLVTGAVDTKTIIDRQPSTCNVSVVGTYKEIIYPCYPKDRSSVNFINGRLTEPYFEDPPGLFEENANVPLKSRVNTVDISQLGQVVHVTDTGVVGVGAINTEKGA